MKNEFIVEMSKDEMLKFYENKIVEDGIRDCTEFSNVIDLGDYGDDIDLSKYKSEILELLYKDERVADVVIDDELNVDMVFYTDYCPFYYDEEESIMYNQIEDNPKYQAKIIEEFLNYIYTRVIEESYISTKTLINGFVDIKTSDKEYSDLMSNFLKKNIIQSGFAEKYISNISVFVTRDNYKDLESCLLNVASQLNSRKEEVEESEEIE